MATNKERIENLEAGLRGLQDSFSRMELGMLDKFHNLEDAIRKITERHGNSFNGRLHNTREGTQENNEGGRPLFSSKLAKLEFPRFSGDDPTEWFTRVDQFFKYQGTPETQKVSLASFHLEGEANQWWQWLHRAFREEGKEVTWAMFQGELWARFGPTECEDFDEALSRVQQVGSLRDYQKEFEKLGNRVQGWTQKALIGTFMGGLKFEIADGIRMFKPKSLKEAISLARMRDDQLTRLQKTSRPFNRTTAEFSTPAKFRMAPTLKRLSREEMQKQRAQGLCFNCDEKFTPGHKCRRLQLLLLEGGGDSCDTDGESDEALINMHNTLEISLHAVTGWSPARTMRVMAKVGSSEMIVLIDSGSTHNFVNEKVTGLLQLPVIPIEPVNVTVANGDPLKCRGRFENVTVLMTQQSYGNP